MYAACCGVSHFVGWGVKCEILSNTETCPPICYRRPHAEVNFTSEWRPIGVVFTCALYFPHSDLIDVFIV